MMYDRTFRPLFSVGRIFKLPPNSYGQRLEYVICQNPSITVPKTTKIVLCKRYEGLVDQAWQISDGCYAIDCLQRLHLTKDQLEKCSPSDILSPDKIEELEDANNFAEDFIALQSQFRF